MKKKVDLKITLITITIIIVVFVCLILLMLFTPQIKLNGSNVSIPYGKEYKEKGYTGYYLNKDITNDVETNNNIDNKKIGTYKVTYKLKKGFITHKVEREVKIIDDKSPIINLKGDINKNICPNSEYIEEGYNAIDEYDGDLTNKVLKIKKNNVLMYYVSDSSNNKSYKFRIINKIDKESPKLELKGDSTMSIKVNSIFNDPGYFIKDNCDKEIKVEINGKVDTSKTGTYKLTYNAKDSSGNEVKKERTVKVNNTYNAPRQSTNLSCGHSGTIYLTFDDGPNALYTPKILDVLKKYNVKATFFVTKNGPDSLIKREYNEGHTVALHTYTHDYAYVYASTENYWKDLNKVSDRVERITGHKSYLFRFPGGSSNTISRRYSVGVVSKVASEATQKGYTYFDWNISSGDAGGTTDPNREYQNVVRNLSKSRGNVILMHDIKRHTSLAIENIVKYGLDNGYSFAPLDSSISCHQTIAN